MTAYRHTQVCLELPVLDLIATAPPTRGEIHTLEIVGGIARADGRGAQLVTCYKDGDRHTLLVAKIYVPLYYAFCGDMSGPTDVTFWADNDYAREAAAYERLQPAPHGFVPLF